jgi:hypothetical protein
VHEFNAVAGARDADMQFRVDDVNKTCLEDRARKRALTPNFAENVL